MHSWMEWILDFAATPWGPFVLVVNAYFEAVILPFPHDPILMTVALADQRNSLLYGAISVLAATLGPRRRAANPVPTRGLYGAALPAGTGRRRRRADGWRDNWKAGQHAHIQGSVSRDRSRWVGPDARGRRQTLPRLEKGLHH